jgi:diguanylate cyclase (GGDEF)-like protein
MGELELRPDRPGERTWSTHQLTEFLALVSGARDETHAMEVAVERAAEALDAEVGAIVVGSRVEVALGVPAPGATGSALETLVGARPGDRERVVLGPLGSGYSATVAIEGVRDGRMVLVRLGDEAFGGAEVSLLHGMARVLGLTLRLQRGIADERRQAEENARLLDSLRRREQLLQRLDAIQRSISDRTRLDETLAAIVDGAVEILGADEALLRLVDPHDPGSMMIVASTGIDDARLRGLRRAPVGELVGGRAIAAGKPVVAHADGDGLAFDDLETVVAVPVFEHGAVVGSIAVGARSRERFQDDDAELLVRFAGHASVALAAARAADAAHSTFHDPLTGLANRRLFLDRLDHALAGAERTGASVTVLFLDLDGFKLVNDSMGHLTGDRVLADVAARLKTSVRKGDTVARLGGDEFGILLGAGGLDKARRIAERVGSAVAEPFDLGGREVRLTASIGIAAGSSEAEDILRDADVAMYQAKSRAPGGYAVFEADMRMRLVEQMALRADLQRAVDRNELGVVFQPIVDLATEATVGLEALIRWSHSERGDVSPSVFVPLAERAGLIRPIGAFVLRESCERLREWREETGGDLAVHVNLSAHELHAGLAREVTAVLRATGIEAGSLVLEITETQLMQDTEATLARLAELRALGVRLAVDDFGTGYSSLRYLRRFPVDILKIAKPFVEDIDRSDGDERALARTIVDLAASMRLATIAEGIETQGELDRLRELGCGLGQGYLFSRPLDAHGVERRLRAERDRAAA